jgi:hypothetical protein
VVHSQIVIKNTLEVRVKKEECSREHSEHCEFCGLNTGPPDYL